MIAKYCKLCHQSFQVYPCRKDKIFFCSKKCRRLGFHHSEKARKKISQTRRIRIKEGHISPPWNKGLHIRINSGKTHFRKGIIPWNKGQKVPQLTGSKHPMWKGGKYTDSNNYVLIHQPNHHLANCRGYVYEHRLIMEQKINRHLQSQEVVHHINQILNDNHPENLLLFPNNKEHRKFHHQLSVRNC